MTMQEVLVTGGTGKTGRRIVQRLREAKIPLRVGSRSAQPAFDWDVETTWIPALAGVDAAYIAYQPDLAIPRAPATIQKFVDTAVASGVKKLVLLSGRGEPEARQCEIIVENSGLEWTVVRASFFAQNFSEGFVLGAIQQGEVILPAVTVPEPFIDVEDIADVATAALITPDHNGKIYDVTGPRLLTFAEAIAEISQEVRRDIHYIPVPIDAYKQGAEQAGLSKDYLWLMEYLFTTIFDGRNAHISDGIQQALGRPPRDFATYVEQVAQTGIWNR